MKSAKKTPTGHWPSGYLLTSSQWKREGRGIKKDELPRKTKAGSSGDYGLYALEQTYLHSEYVKAKNFLIELFVGWPVRFGYRCKDRSFQQILSENVPGGAQGTISRGFNLESCRTGINIWGDKAESFHVLAQEKTRFVVIDLDNHSPTHESTTAHLEALQLILSNLNHLVDRVGGTSTFFQYRCVDPTGIHIWIVLDRPHPTKIVTTKVQEFLKSLANPKLDEQLNRVGLCEFAKIEIRPSSTPISMPGAYGKELFTTKRLTPIDQKVDCVGLAAHIRGNQLGGDVMKRYGELVGVMMGQDVIRPAIPLPLPKVTAELNKRDSWNYLKTIALEGVHAPDYLFEDYILPLAQCLYFREFVIDKNREELVTHALIEWIKRKHNNQVSRITSNRMRDVEQQIQRTVKGIEKYSSTATRQFYKSMVAKDGQFPDKVERITELMTATPTTPHSFMSYCKGGVSSVPQTTTTPEKKRPTAQSELSNDLKKWIQKYADKNLRMGKSRKRFVSWAVKFIKEIGPEGEKHINTARLNTLAGKAADHDRTYLKKYKNHLVEMNVLKPGWTNGIKRGERSSRYVLQEWVLKELRPQE